MHTDGKCGDKDEFSLFISVFAHKKWIKNTIAEAMDSKVLTKPVPVMNSVVEIHVIDVD